MSLPLGTKVQIGAGIDDCFDPDYTGKEGIVIGYETIRQGKLIDLVLVEFENGLSDTFWPQELIIKN